MNNCQKNIRSFFVIKLIILAVRNISQGLVVNKLDDYIYPIFSSVNRKINNNYY